MIQKNDQQTLTWGLSTGFVIRFLSWQFVQFDWSYFPKFIWTQSWKGSFEIKRIDHPGNFRFNPAIIFMLNIWVVFVLFFNTSCAFHATLCNLKEKTDIDYCNFFSVLMNNNVFPSTVCSYSLKGASWTTNICKFIWLLLINVTGHYNISIHRLGRS